MSILGVYWRPEHMRQGDLDYMARLQPPAIRLLDPDASTMNRAHHAAPKALLLPRDWALSEQHSDLEFDPAGTGIRHAQEWRTRLDRWRSQGLTVPQDQIIVVGINEPRVWEALTQTVAYTVAWLDECTRLGLRACALNLSVGWPANTGSDTPPDWTPYAPVEAAIKRGNHVLVVHEYWYRSGPQDGASWWAYRINRCPWDVPVIIGECGIDNHVDLTRWQNEGKPPRGWQGNVNGEGYADQMVRYAQGLDRRVVAILPFMTDFADRQWSSFDTEPAHGALLSRRDQMVPQATFVPPATHTVHLPNLQTTTVQSNGSIFLPSTPSQTGTDPNANWQRSRAFVARWEGGYVDHPADPGGATNKGVTLGTYTRWRQAQGLPAPTKDDLRNLSDEEADAIYYQWYWRPSGAANLAWPLCLLVFDTAVLHGPAAAQEFLGTAGTDARRFLAARMLSYVQMRHWATFGVAWGNRVRDLLAVVEGRDA